MIMGGLLVLSGTVLPVRYLKILIARYFSWSLFSSPHRMFCAHKPRLTLTSSLQPLPFPLRECPFYAGTPCKILDFSFPFIRDSHISNSNERSLCYPFLRTFVTFSYMPFPSAPAFFQEPGTSFYVIRCFSYPGRFLSYHAPLLHSICFFLLFPLNLPSFFLPRSSTLLARFSGLSPIFLPCSRGSLFFD